MILGNLLTNWKRYNIQDTAYDPLVVTKTAPHEWTLVKPSVFRWIWNGGQQSGVLVPAGFSAAASVPHFLESFASAEVLFDGAVLHDLLYWAQGGARYPVHDWRSNEAVVWSRERCDALAFAFWLASGVPVGTAELAYAAVSLFGGEMWRER